MIKRNIIALLLALVASQAGAQTTQLKGDTDKSGTVTLTDVTFLINVIKGRQTTYDTNACDVVKDNKIDIYDVEAVLSILLGKGTPGQTQTGISNEDATGPANVKGNERKAEFTPAMPIRENRRQNASAKRK